MVVLAVIHPEPVRVRPRRDSGIASRQAGHFARGAQVPLEQRWRHLQDAGDVVESIALIVCRKQLRGINLDIQQVADRILVLGAIEPVDRFRPAGIGPRCRYAIDLAFQPARDTVIGRDVRSGTSRRRHGPRSKLPYDLFPRVRLRRHVRQAEPVKRKVGSPELLIVAGEAVLLEDCSCPFGRRAN